jgi:5'(3')-deoxyribonucleotidase
MNMIEKISRALCQKCATEEPLGWDIDRDWHLFRNDAVIALEAMKEPTKEMLDAFNLCIWQGTYDDAYDDAISVALKAE